MATVGSLLIRLGLNSQEFSKGLSGAFKQVDRLGQRARRAGVSLTAGLTLPILGIGAAIIKAGTDFETGFAGVRKTIDLTEEEAKSLKSELVGLFETLPVTDQELFGIAESAGQLGIAKDRVVEFTRTIIDLKNTTNLSAEEASVSLARLSNVTTLTQDQFSNMGSVLVALGNNMAANEAEILEMTRRLSGAGTTAKLTAQEIAGIGAGLVSAGINAEAGGTAISKVFIRIASAVSTGSEDLVGLAKVAGQTAEQFAESYRKGPARAIVSFIEGLGRIEQAGGNLFATLESLDIKEQRLRDSLLLAANAGDLLTQGLDIQNEAFMANSALTEEAAKRYDTLASRFQVFQNRIKALAARIEESLEPLLKGLLVQANRLLDVGARMVRAFEQLDTAGKKQVVLVAALAAGLGPFLIGLSVAISLIRPWTLLVAAVVSAGVAAKVVFENWSTIGPALLELFNAMTTALLNILSNFNNLLPSILQAIAANFDTFLGPTLFLGLAVAWLKGGKILVATLAAIQASTLLGLLTWRRLFITAGIASVIVWLANEWDKHHKGALTKTLQDIGETIKTETASWATFFDAPEANIRKTGLAVDDMKGAFEGLKNFLDTFTLGAFFDGFDARVLKSFNALKSQIESVKMAFQSLMDLISNFSFGDIFKGVSESIGKTGLPSLMPEVPTASIPIPEVPPTTQRSWEQLEDTIGQTQQNVESLNRSLSSSDFTDLLDKGLISRSTEAVNALDDIEASLSRIQALQAPTGEKEFFQAFKTRITEQIGLLEQTREDLLAVQKMGEQGLLDVVSERFDKVLEEYNRLFNEIAATEPKVEKSSIEMQAEHLTATLVTLRQFNQDTFRAMGQEVMSWGNVVQAASMDTKAQVEKDLAEVRAQIAALDEQANVEPITLPPIDTSSIDTALADVEGRMGQLSSSMITDAQKMSSGIETEMVGTVNPALELFRMDIERIRVKWEQLLLTIAQTPETKGLFDFIALLKTMGDPLEEVKTALKEVPREVDRAMTQATASTRKAVSFWDILFKDFKFSAETVFTDIRNAAVFTWGSIQSQFVSSLANMIQGIGTFKEFMVQFWNTLLQAGLNVIITLAAQWALSHFAQRETATQTLIAQEAINTASLASTAATETARAALVLATNKLFLGAAATTVAAMITMGETSVALMIAIVGAIAAVYEAIAAGLAAGVVTAKLAPPFAAAAKIIAGTGIGAAKIAGTAVAAAGKAAFASIGGLAGPIPGLQTGGIVTGPTLAMLAEGGEPEVVLPLDKLDSMGGRREQTIVIEMDGRRIMEKLIPHLPKLVRMKLGAAM